MGDGMGDGGWGMRDEGWGMRATGLCRRVPVSRVSGNDCVLHYKWDSQHSERVIAICEYGTPRCRSCSRSIELQSHFRRLNALVWRANCDARWYQSHRTSRKDTRAPRGVSTRMHYLWRVAQ